MMNTVFSQIYYYRPMHDLGWSLLFFIVWVAIIGILVYLVYYFVTYHHRNWPSHHVSDPLEIAKIRYAKGEIDKTEFEEIKKALLP